MTEEQKSISRKNRSIARKILNPPKGYCMHHIDPSWKTKDIERYIQWNIDDLVVMSNSEHTKYHCQFREYVSGEKSPHYGHKMSDETRQIISDANIGNKNACGKRSEETCKNISNSLTGRNLSDEHKKAVSEGLKRYWAKRKLEKEILI